MTSYRSIRSFNHSERGASLVEYGVVIAVIALVVWAAVAHFGKKSEPSSESRRVTKEAKTVELIYRGNILTCVDFSKVPDVGGISFSCLFADFYKHPRKAPGNSKLKQASLIKLKLNGKDLYCLHHDASDYTDRAANCDDIRFAHDPMAG